MRRRSGKAFAAVVVAAVTGLAGCGSSADTHVASTEPGLAGAVQGLQSRSSLTIKAYLDMTPAQILAEPGSSATPKGAADVADTAVVFSYGTGNGKPLSAYKSLAADLDATVSFEVERSGSAPLQVVVDKGALYVRVDLAQAESDYGTSPSFARTAGAYLARLARKAPSLAPLVDGDWVTMDKAQLASIAGFVKGEEQRSGVKQPSPGMIAGIDGALRKDLGQATTSRQITTSGAGTQYAVEVHVGQLLDDLVAQPYFRSVLGATNSPVLRQLPMIERKLSATTATATATEVGGTLTEIRFDLAQFAPRRVGAHPVPLVLDFSGAAPAGPPAHAADINPVQVFGELSGM